MATRCGVLSLFLGMTTVCACGTSDHDAPEIADGGNGSSGGGSSGSATNGGADGGGNVNDGGSSGGSEGGAPGLCEPAAAATGALLGFADLGYLDQAQDLAASCDGSFVAVGQPLEGISFTKRDGTTIDLPTATVWVARFDPDGFPLWAKGILTGTIDEGQYTHVAAFPDGSVIVDGNFGKSVVFDAGGPGETTLTGGTPSPEGYVARYASDGTFQWAKQLGDRDFTSVPAVSAAPDGTAYAVVASERYGGETIGPGELDLVLAADEGAIVALDPAGHFLRSVQYGATTFGEYRVAVLGDGGLLFYGLSGAGLVLARGTANETAITGNSFYARFNADLSLDWAHGVTDGVAFDVTTSFPFRDGSIGFASPLAAGTVTLGKGQPHETTLTSTMNDGLVVGRYGPDGQLAWATNVGSDDSLGGIARPRSVTTLGDSLWLGGSYELDGTASTDLAASPGTADSVKVHVDGAQATFVFRFDAGGKPLWGVPMIGTKIPPALMLSAASGSVVMFGDFLGTETLGSKTFTSVTDGDSFVARFGP